jgi:membrane fusion protein (multidrug efflux system)
MAADVAPDPSARASGARRRGFAILGAVVVAGAIGYGAWWLLVARHFQSTDDAYVAADVVQVSAEQAGTVIAVHIDDTQAVQAGQLLVELDPADAKLAMDDAEAELARSVRAVRALYAQVAQLRAQIAEREAAVSRAEADVKRRDGLTSDGAVSAEEVAHARDTAAEVRAGLAAAREQLASSAAQVEGTTLATHPQVLHAASAVRTAALALRRTRLEAPLAGIVAKRGVQVGARVAAGAPLMAVVPLDEVWVEANFKEVQLAHMRVGQSVTLHADLYGGSADFHGHVAGMSAGSGSAFALLPAQNASGNWIKIVQRVPVRIALDAGELHDHPLRVGLSMSVKVDVRDESGPAVAASVRTRELAARSGADAEQPAIDARIAQIIAQNGGAGGGASTP